MAVQTQIQTRRGTAATWTSTNPTLAAGEIGFESDTNKFKIGTGSTAWASLPYAASLSPLTTKGDLYTFDTADARLPVGADGEQIVADSSTSTGLAYSPAPAVGNPVINSAFQIWQRGTSFTSTGYTADRWYGSTPTDITISRQLTGDTTNLPNIQYCVRLARTAGSTAAVYPQVTNSFESVNTVAYVGKTITFSFYARRGANFSGASNQIFAMVQTGTGTDQNVYNGYTGEVNAVGSTGVTLTTTWQRFTYTGTIATNVTEMGIKIYALTSGTAGAADWFEVTGVQIDLGSTALPFRTFSATLQGELSAAQRYFWRDASSLDTGNYHTYATGDAATTTRFFGFSRMPVAMRTAPSLTGIAAANYAVYILDAVKSINSINGNDASPTGYGFYLDAPASSFTAGTCGRFISNNNQTSYIDYSAEL
jgi:hypothetical protein